MSDINQTTVIGAGAMGHGIAQVFAQAGCEVIINDIDVHALKRVPGYIQSNLALLAKYEIIDKSTISSVQKRIQLEPRFKIAVKKADLLLEAVPERVDLKQKIFVKAEAHCAEDAILATTTSVIRVGDIAMHCKRPNRVVGTHWMNPPFVLPLVEIIRGPKTAQTVINQTKVFLEEKCRKRTVTCNDTPGFLVNRMAGAVLKEAAKLIEDGIASFHDIDQVWKEHLGPVFLLYGPFGNLDHIGLDIVVLAAKYLAWALQDESYTLPHWLESKVNAGDLGVKSGKGIYEYANQKPEELRQQRVEDLLRLLRQIGLDRTSNLV